MMLHMLRHAPARYVSPASSRVVVTTESLSLVLMRHAMPRRRRRCSTNILRDIDVYDDAAPSPVPRRAAALRIQVESEWQKVGADGGRNGENTKMVRYGDSERREKRHDG